MNRKAWQLRLLILQMLAAASLIACPWLAAAWERGESWALHAGNPAVSLAYPLALGLTAYVLWALAVHLTGLTLRPRWLRAVLGAVSVLLVLSLGVFQCIGGGAVRVTDEYGNVIQEETIEADPITPGQIGALAGMFLVSNIPTVVFDGIWLYYKNRRDFKDDLKKMKIEDLE